MFRHLFQPILQIRVLPVLDLQTLLAEIYITSHIIFKFLVNDVIYIINSYYSK